MEKDESGYFYRVRKGDTLWDLSRRFLNSPHYWPDLWEANNDVPITNPHIIYPGQKIRLYRKGDGYSFTPEDLETDTSPVFSAEGPEEEPQAILEESGASLSDIPGAGGRENPYVYYSQIDRVGFVRNPSVSPHGVIFDVVGNKKILSTGDTIYIRGLDRDNPIILGKQYLVYRTFEPIKDDRTGDVFGRQHYLTGVVEIVKREPKYYIARITKAFRSVFVEDMLMPFTRRDPNIKRKPAGKDIAGRIIGTEEEGANLLGENSIAFLDKGSVEGLEPGQEFFVYYQNESEIDSITKEKVVLSPVVYGKLIVLLTEDHTATALITRSNRVIYIGSLFRSPF